MTVYHKDIHLALYYYNGVLISSLLLVIYGDIQDKFLVKTIVRYLAILKSKIGNELWLTITQLFFFIYQALFWLFFSYFLLLKIFMFSKSGVADII